MHILHGSLYMYGKSEFWASYSSETKMPTLPCSPTLRTNQTTPREKSGGRRGRHTLLSCKGSDSRGQVYVCNGRACHISLSIRQARSTALSRCQQFQVLLPEHRMARTKPRTEIFQVSQNTAHTPIPLTQHFEQGTWSEQVYASHYIQQHNHVLFWMSTQSRCSESLQFGQRWCYQKESTYHRRQGHSARHSKLFVWYFAVYNDGHFLKKTEWVHGSKPYGKEVPQQKK